LSDILINGITELHQSGKRVGLVFQGAGGEEQWAISPSYKDPGGSSTQTVSFKRPTDPKITASTAAQFQAVLTDQDIWDSTWTYLKKNTDEVPYGPSSTNPPPYPNYPLPAGDQDVTAPQGVDIGTGSLVDSNQNQTGLLYREGVATSNQWAETWVLDPSYPTNPAGSILIAGAPAGTNFANRDEFLTYVRNNWREGTRVFTVSSVYYKGNMPTP